MGATYRAVHVGRSSRPAELLDARHEVVTDGELLGRNFHG